MLEFIFFDTELRDRFVVAIKQYGLSYEVRDDHFGWVVGVDESVLDDTLILDIEVLYDTLQDEQMHKIEQSEGGLQKHVAGFSVKLPDGNHTTVAIPPDLAARLMEHFSFDDIHHLFSRVAAAAINPDHRPICQREDDV